jgi:hypothetical protein
MHVLEGQIQLTPVQHALEVHYDSVIEKPQLS